MILHPVHCRRPSDCPDCPSTVDSQYPQRCWAVLQTTIRDTLKPLIYVCSGASVVFGMALLGALYLCYDRWVTDRRYVQYTVFQRIIT